METTSASRSGQPTINTTAVSGIQRVHSWGAVRTATVTPGSIFRRHSSGSGIASTTDPGVACIWGRSIRMWIARNTWSGVGAAAGSTAGPHGIDNMIFTSMRYYLP